MNRPSSSVKRPVSDLSQNVRSSSESPITVPASTSEWNSEDVCNRLQITLINQKDPRSLFVRGYLRFLQQNDNLIDYMKTHYESPDLEYRVKQACYKFALCNWEHVVHCDSFQYLQVTDAIKMKRELQKTFEESFIKEFFHSEEEFKIIDSKKGVGLSDEENKIKSIVIETCMLIFGNLRLFSHQLLYLIYNKENTSERMYQDLFLAFVRLFGLNICDTTNSPGSCFKFYHGKTVTLSEPDAVISSFTLSSKFDCKVIAVVEVAHVDDENLKMADDERKTKRSRVRKGPYNQYLRDNNPFKTAPKAFRTEGKQDSATDPSPSSNPLHADEAVTDLQSNSAQECVGITSDQDYEGADDSNIGEHLITDKHKDGNNFNMEFMKDIVEQRKLINDFVEEEYLNSDFPEEYEMQHNIPVFPHEYEDIDCDSGEVLHTDMHSNSSKDSHEANETVHPHTSLTVGASMLLIMSFALKHSLTGEGLSDLLSLVDLHCPSENKIPKTLGQFRKWFADIKNPLVFHKYCTFCHMYLAENEVNEICPNEKCQAKLTDESISQFIEIPIGTQIKTLFSRPSFLQDISYRFSRKKKQPNTIEDIYDGEIYRNLSENNGVLNQPYNLSLLWNTDGIPCFKSSKMSLWPLLFQINELPYSKRSDPDNMILGGLWYGPKKPSIMCFTEPFLQNLQDLEENGIDIIDSVGVIHTCKVFVIGGSADMPARRLLCNTIQFNGKFGCCKCLQPGETFKTGKGGHCHIFPFESTCPDGPVRTHAGIMNDSIAAVENGKPQNGVKGPNFLQCLKYYDLAKGTCIDYMHGVLLGVAKLLLTLWFSSEHNNEIFSLSHFVDVVDAKLVNIKPPNSIKRTPRSIKEHVKYWKASELRSWLLYYSAPILLNIQDQEYLKHYLLFVNAVFILLQSSITLEDLKRAEEDILQFVSMFNVFYGDRYMTCNLHQLIHLPQLVFDMGPLWAYSCFPFENYNGILLKLFHGTQHIDLQIGQTVSLMQRLPELQYKHLKPNSLEMELFQSMKGVSQKTDKLLESNISAMGALKKTKISQADHKILSSFLEQDLTDYVTFNRIKIGNDIIHSRNYQRCSVRNSYTIAFKQENEDTLNIGQIEYYLQLQHCITHNCTTSRCHCAPLHVAVVRHFRNEDSGLLSDLRHVFTVTSEPKRITFSIVLLKNILFKCVLIDIKDSKLSYVCKMPNLLERD